MPNPETKLIHTGRTSEACSGMVNTPVHRASTILFPTLKSYHEAHVGKSYYPTSEGTRAQDYSYATTGTPSHYALEKIIGALEGGYTTLTPSGLSAITTSLLAFLKSGDHLLMTDAAYGPTRRFCDQVLAGLGVETTYYDPRIGSGIAALIRENTRLIFTESPGSLTFEIQDIPAIVKEAHAKHVLVAMDNSWATPLCFQPLAHGVDISLQAATKYIGGHSDLLMGTITTTEAHIEKILTTHRNLGASVSPDVCYLAERGIRTMAVRLKQHADSALHIAKWLETRPEVSRVLYPALASHPDHAMWKRDFKGATGLFSVVLKEHHSFEALSRMIEPLRYFGIGSSWGGYESLCIVINPNSTRSATPWKAEGSVLRIYVGLENVEDLIEDVKSGFDRLKETV